MTKHKFELKNATIKSSRGGSRIMQTNIGLMALGKITLEKGGIREPHWHPNADELTYCSQGKATVTLFMAGNARETFTLNAGDVMFVPKGYLHHIENIHDGITELILGFNNGNPEDLDLSESVGSMSAHVLASTFGVPDSEFQKFVGTQDVFIAERKEALEPKSLRSSPHRFDLERIHPQIASNGGLARIVNKDNLPVLRDLALFSVRLFKGGVREPHWHPNATELNYVLKGKARLTVFSPGSDKDTFTLTVGEGSIIPAGYFHHIENIGDEELHMTVFFNNAEPNDIGLSGALSTYAPETLASVFSEGLEFFKNLPHFHKDRMIVSGGG